MQLFDKPDLTEVEAQKNPNEIHLSLKILKTFKKIWPA